MARDALVGEARRLQEERTRASDEVDALRTKVHTLKTAKELGEVTNGAAGELTKAAAELIVARQKLEEVTANLQGLGKQEEAALRNDAMIGSLNKRKKWPGGVDPEYLKRAKQNIADRDALLVRKAREAEGRLKLSTG